MSAACVRVAIGGEHFAVGVEQALEVAEVRELTPVPGAPSSVLGVINRDGQVLAVVDLARLIGTSSSGRPGCLLVVEDGGRRAGLAVDEILDVGPAPVLTEATSSDMLRGAALVDGSLVGMLEVAAVLDGAGHRGGGGHGA
jgi:purine-binding chemotaxis protein CheW